MSLFNNFDNKRVFNDLVKIAYSLSGASDTLNAILEICGGTTSFKKLLKSADEKYELELIVDQFKSGKDERTIILTTALLSAVLVDTLKDYVNEDVLDQLLAMFDDEYGREATLSIKKGMERIKRSNLRNSSGISLNKRSSVGGLNLGSFVDDDDNKRGLSMKNPLGSGLSGLRMNRKEETEMKPRARIVEEVREEPKKEDVGFKKENLVATFSEGSKAFSLFKEFTSSIILPVVRSDCRLLYSDEGAMIMGYRDFETNPEALKLYNEIGSRRAVPTNLCIHSDNSRVEYRGEYDEARVVNTSQTEQAMLGKPIENYTFNVFDVNVSAEEAGNYYSVVEAGKDLIYRVNHNVTAKATVPLTTFVGRGKELGDFLETLLSCTKLSQIPLTFVDEGEKINQGSLYAVEKILVEKFNDTLFANFQTDKLAESVQNFDSCIAAAIENSSEQLGVQIVRQFMAKVGGLQVALGENKVALVEDINLVSTWLNSKDFKMSLSHSPLDLEKVTRVANGQNFRGFVTDNFHPILTKLISVGSNMEKTVYLSTFDQVIYKFVPVSIYSGTYIVQQVK